MSRLEQMRQHFLQQVFNEQQTLLLTRPAMSYAKSIHHIPSLTKLNPPSSHLRRTPSVLSSIHFSENDCSFLKDGGEKLIPTNISRIKSLNNVSLIQTSRVKSINTKIKQTSETKRNLTLNVNSNVITTIATSTVTTTTNNEKVNRPTKQCNGWRILSAEQKCTTANNNNRSELQCKHCSRKFAAQ